MKTISVDNADPLADGFPLIIPIAQINYLDKLNDTNIARIHLINGEVLLSTDSLKTIQAKIDLEKN